MFGTFDAKISKANAQFHWSTELSSCGPVSLVSGYYTGEWELRSLDSTPEMLSLIRARHGCLHASLGGETIEGAAGAMLLINNNEADKFFLRGDHNLSDVLFVDWKTVVQAVTAAYERPVPKSLGLPPKLDLSNPTGQVIANTVDLIISGMRNNGPLLHSPLALSHLTDGLVDLVIKTLPHHISSTSGPGEAAHWQVQAAIDFMHANIDQPITSQVIAHAIGVSSRSLDKRFQASLGLTPASYLRRIRLEAVRRDLLDRDLSLTIKEACLKWGFFHLGRFAGVYQKAFGESPSDTRRRALLGRGIFFSDDGRA